VIRFLALLPAILFFPAPAFAGGFYFQTGNSLYEICRASDAACMPYIVGVADSVEMNLVYDGVICLPAGATQGQIADVATQFMRDHPEDRALSAAAIVTRSLVLAFPCPSP
jgi:hypothetical protein